MKFTDGYWVIKPEYDLHFATESYRALTTDDALSVLCPTVPILHRGDTLNSATLTVTFTAPLQNVIRVCIKHFAGVVPRGPRFELSEAPATPLISQCDDAYTFTSGALSASVSRLKRGWRVTYSAQGRKLTESGYHAMAHAQHRQSGQSYMIDSLDLDVGERVYGLGERFTPYVKNGQTVDIWNADGGTASELAYKNVPFYMTNRGYGVFVDSSSAVSFEVGSEKVERVQFSLPGEKLVYHIIYGATPKDIMERFTALTGRPALPPAWSFGLWLSTSFTTNYDEATVSSFIDGMAQRDIPLGVFHFDCFWMKGYNWTDLRWDDETFPDPAGMLRRLKARGLHTCCWINPYIAQASPLFREGMAAGYLICKENGDVWQTDMWQAGMGILDVTHPAARDWFTGHLKQLLDMGVDAFKTDFGERIPVSGIVYHDGSDPLAMHNYYAYLYNKMVFELLERERGIGEAVVFARSATAGCQKFPVHWNGDSSASYLSMAETLRSGLSISHSGFAFWSHDIAGFEQTASADIYKRWAAFGLLCSHSRLHGSSSYRVPWLFDLESCDVLRTFAKLKCRLMPYLYAAAVEAHRTGIPLLRPMMFEFPDDIACETCDTQYMLGAGLLVAPVFHADGHVDYYLPAGRWTSLLTGEMVQGGRWRHEVHGFMTLPLLVRENTLLPLGAVDDRADYDYTDRVALHIFEPGEGELSLQIPDLKGETAAGYRLHLVGDEVIFRETSDRPGSVVVHRAGRRENSNEGV
ncbi:MAG: alpha-xylosidase [Christensenellales bacterium]